MMFKFNSSSIKDDGSLLTSQLYNEQSFFPAFIADAKRATESIIIESPFITYQRLNWLYPCLVNAIQKGVKIIINTCAPESHEGIMQQYAIEGIAALQKISVEVLYTGNHHRKLAIIDHGILWEGSLNILSQSDSSEIMRRINSAVLADAMIDFIGLHRWYNLDKL